MQIQVESIGLPGMAVIDGVSVGLLETRNSLQGLVESLAGQFGAEVSTFLLHETGRLDPEVLLLVNDREVYGNDRLAGFRFADGDRVKFVLMVGGG